MIRPNVSATKNSQYCAGFGVEKCTFESWDYLIITVEDGGGLCT